MPKEISQGSELPFNDADPEHDAIMEQMRSDKTPASEAAQQALDEKEKRRTGGEVEAESEIKAEPEDKTTEDDDLYEGLDKDVKTVPTSTLVNERRKLKRRAKEAEERAQAAERERLEFMEKANERLAKMLAKDEPEEKKEVKEETNPYSFEEQPFEHLQWKTDKAERDNAALRQKFTETQTQTEEQKKYIQTVTEYQTGHKAYAEKNPQFQQAYEHVIKSWVGQAIASGIPQDQAVAYAQQTEWNLINIAKQNGQSPHERLMEVAKVIGWQPQKGDGVDNSQEAQAAAKRAQTEKLKTLKDAESVIGSLSESAGGKTAELTIKQIVDMPDDEFDAWMAVPGNKRKFQLMKQGRMGTASV